MKKIFLSAALLVFFCNSILAQNTEKKITAIRTEVAAINKAAAKYTKKPKDIDGISLEGTQAVYYISGKVLKKIVARMYGESYNATGEFYYQGEEFIFAFVKFNKYDMPIGSSGNSPKVVQTEEQRFYFAGGDLIRLLVGKTELKSGSDRYTQLKDEITGISKKLQEAYN